MQYDWIVARECCPVTDNQNPNLTKPLFKLWTERGWEVVSVSMSTVPLGSTFDSIAIGVLRKPAT